MKICSKCKIEKDVSEFNKHRNRIDGLQDTCKRCQNEYGKQWNYKNIQKNNDETYVLWVFFNKKKNCNKCGIKKDINEFSKSRNGIDGYKSYCKECDKECDKKRYKDNKEHIKENSKKWSEENPEKVLEKNRKYRARKNNADGSFTEKEFKEKLVFYQYKCCKCGTDLRKTDTHRDHVKPLSIGGTDYISNIQPLCKPCNCSKSADWIDYRDTWLRNYAI